MAADRLRHLPLDPAERLCGDEHSHGAEDSDPGLDGGAVHDRQRAEGGGQWEKKARGEEEQD
jgi:hypothetical protein